MNSSHDNRSIATRNPLRYRGYYYDNETQLYYLPARYYNPDTARFLSVDPAPPSAGDPTSLNGYAYCVGDPVQLVDPDGRKAIMDGDDGWHAPTHKGVGVGSASVSVAEDSIVVADLPWVGEVSRPDAVDLTLDAAGTFCETLFWIGSAEAVVTSPSIAGAAPGAALAAGANAAEGYLDLIGLLYKTYQWTQGDALPGDVKLEFADLCTSALFPSSTLSLTVIDPYLYLKE